MGTLLLSCSMDKTIKVWDLQGNCIKTMTEHTRYVNCMAVNSDSTVFCSGSNDRTILIWDLTNALTLDSHLTGVRSILFTLASSSTEIPLEFICPITHEIMKDPVIAEGKLQLQRTLDFPKSRFFERFRTRYSDQNHDVPSKNSKVANFFSKKREKFNSFLKNRVFTVLQIKKPKNQ